MNKDRRPTPEEVRAALRYEPESGKLFWRHRPDARPQWNGRYAGKEAFTAIDNHGYRHGTICNHHVRAHRVIWVILHGSWPVAVDHEDQHRLHNKGANLREADQATNCKNMRMYRNNTSGAVGVYYDKSRERWVASIGIKPGFIGRFDTFEAAVAARKKAEALLHYHPNHGRPAHGSR